MRSRHPEDIYGEEIEFWYVDKPDKPLKKKDEEHIKNEIKNHKMAGQLSNWDGWWQIVGKNLL